MLERQLNLPAVSGEQTLPRLASPGNQPAHRPLVQRRKRRQTAASQSNELMNCLRRLCLSGSDILRSVPTKRDVDSGGQVLAGIPMLDVVSGAVVRERRVRRFPPLLLPLHQRSMSGRQQIRETSRRII